MRPTVLSCFVAAMLVVGFTGAARAQLVMAPIPFPESPVQDWAKYHQKDLHREGFTYLGHGAWAKGWIGFGGASSMPLTWNMPFIPLWYGYGPSESTPGSSYSSSTAPNPFGEVAPDSGSPSPARRRPLMLKPKPRAASAETIARIEKLIADGDEQFTKQKYGLAAKRYWAASQVTRNSAEAYFRQGFALIAQGNYAAATTAFRSGLALRQDWAESPFQLDQIYAPGALKKTNARLASKLAEDPVEPNLLAAMGMQLYFSGDRDKSAIYVTQASQLGALDATLVDPFLPRPEPPRQPPAKP